ncbi:MAG: 5-formyltetrahydrofolate cyclo-ligase [Pseudomonadales bacterium]
MDARQALRKQMRTARRQLSDIQQHTAAQALAANIIELSAFNASHSVAIYLSSDGEIDTQAVIEHCWAQGKDVYLPVLDPDRVNALLFVHYDRQTPMCHNKYQILEPATPYQKTLPAQALDLVLLPLVSFDSSGNRMGMGGGYYDRTFAFKAEQPTAQPTLIGMAHELQRVASLPVASWDIPLAGIASDKQFYPAA